LFIIILAVVKTIYNTTIQMIISMLSKIFFEETFF